MVVAGDVTLALAKGELIVLRPRAERFEPVARYRLAVAQTQAHPVFLGDRILVRHTTSLACFTVSP
jgi:hypothetical protein